MTIQTIRQRSATESRPLEQESRSSRRGAGRELGDVRAADLRFSGHESFACRYAWLPKAYRALRRDPLGLADDEKAMVELGVGKNMVRSIRFWVEVAGVATASANRRYELTPFGRAVLDENGFDPFLEDVRTLWLVHWNISTRRERPVFAWRYMLNHWPHGDFTRAEVEAAFARESERLGLRHSAVTLAQHLDIFIHTYLRSHAGDAGEDSLDGPLVPLAFLQQVGARQSESRGRHEAVFAFRIEPKGEITKALFEFCLNDLWSNWHANELTMTYRDVAFAVGSIGRIFKLPEDDIRERLELYSDKSSERFTYRPSVVQGLLSRRSHRARNFLAGVYQRPESGK